MNAPVDHNSLPESIQKYGCFWATGLFGALTIIALAVGEWIGFPRIDGPFGGIVWLFVQGCCFLICLVGSIQALLDKPLTAPQRARMWILTFFPSSLLQW